MSRWIVICMLAALICGNLSESQFDNDDVNNSPSLEIVPDTDSYSSDTRYSTSKSKVIKRRQMPAKNKIKTIKPVYNPMAGLYPEKLRRTPAKSNHPISDLIYHKDPLLNPSDSVETYQPPNKKSQKVDERSKRFKTTREHELTRTTDFKKGQEHSREYNSASSYDESAYKEPKRIPKLVTVRQVMHKKKREHTTTDDIMHESELDASNDKFISKMKRENAKMLKVTKKNTHDKHNHRHESNKDKHTTKTDRQKKREPERISSTSDKIHNHKVDTKVDSVESTSKESKPNTHHSVKHQHEKHKENQHVLKPEPVVHFSLKDMLKQNKNTHQHKVTKKNSQESQMNSLELEDAMAKPNGLLKPFDGNVNLKDEFTLTVVDINDTAKKQKTVYKFRDEGNQVPIQSNAIPPIDMSATAEKGTDYLVPIVPLQSNDNHNNNNKATTLKPVQPVQPVEPVEPIVPLPEVEIGVHDNKNDHKLNSSVQKMKKEKDKIRSREEVSDSSKSEIHLTQSSEESDDEFAYIGYLSDKHNKGKILKDLLRDGSGKSGERKIARKSWLGCLGKKAQKICIKSCNAAYKNVCKRLKCSSKAKKDLKTQCKKSCKKAFKSGSGKKSKSSDSYSSRSSDSSF